MRSSVATGFSPPDPQDRIFASGNPAEPANPRKPSATTSVSSRRCSRTVALRRELFPQRSVERDRLQQRDFRHAQPRQRPHAGRGSIRRVGTRRAGCYCARRTPIWTRSTLPAGSFGNLRPGARLPRRPRNEAFLSVGYRWPGPLKHLSTSLEAKIVNGREDVTFNALGQRTELRSGRLHGAAAGRQITGSTITSACSAASRT